MALSGSSYTTVATNFRLQYEWTATQSISGNSSTVTVKLYWMSMSSGAVVYSSATKTNSITIDSTVDNASASSMAALSGNQKKLINTASKTVSHNADGTGDVRIRASFDANVTLNGQYVGTVSLDKTFTLNTIPRKSTLTDSTPSFTAPDSLSIGINRASSSFTHRARINLPTEKVVTGITTSKTISFTSTELTAMFAKMNGSSSTTYTLTLDTYSSSSQTSGNLIGSNSYTLTVYAPSTSTTTGSGSFNIGTTISGTISEQDSSFTHTLKVVFPHKTYTILNQSSTLSWSWACTGTTANEFYAAMTTVTSKSGTLELTTYYNGEKIRTTRDYTLTAKVVNSNPTFSSSQVSYSDSTKSGITTNNQVIVQNQSMLRINIASAASAKNYSSIVGYNVKVGNIDKTVSGTGNHDVGVVNLSSSSDIKIRAIDSRGLYTEVSLPVTIVPYSPPTMGGKVNRINNFEDQVEIEVSGAYSVVSVGGTARNYLTKAQYQYRQRPSGTWSSLSSLTITHNSATKKYTCTRVVTPALDNTKSYDFKIVVTDRFTTTDIPFDFVVKQGIPLISFDVSKKFLGINTFWATPDYGDTHLSLAVQGDYGRAHFWTRPSVVSNNESTLMLSTAQHPTGGLQIFTRQDSTGLWDRTDGITFLRYTPVGGNGSQSGDVTLSPSGSGKVQVNSSLEATGSVRGSLIHKGGYMPIESFSATYGTGQAEFWYRPDERTLNLISRHPGDSGAQNAKFYAERVLTVALESNVGANGYLQCDTSSEYRVTAYKTTSTYRPIRASSFPTGSSINYKTNLENIDNRLDSLEMLNSVDVWHYHLKSNVESRIYDKPKLGFISEMVPSIMRDQDGVDTYSILGINWRATQMLSSKVDNLELSYADILLVNEQQTLEIEQLQTALDSAVAEIAQIKETMANG